MKRVSAFQHFSWGRAVVGLLPESAYQAADENGISLLQALRQGGLQVRTISKNCNYHTISSYVEVHMEQGPVIEALENHSPVTAISGQTRLSISVHGTQGHAGTVPMTARKNAVAAAAEIIHLIESLARPELKTQMKILCWFARWEKYASGPGQAT